MPQNTFEGFAADLQHRLDAARDAITSGKIPAMKVAHADLADFIATSDDTLPGIIELDDVASDAMRDVTLARLDQSLVKNLSERSADVARLVKTFSTQAGTNDSAAAAIRLERAKAVASAALTIVDEMKKLSETVDDSTAGGAKLAQAIKDAIAAVTAVQKKLAS